MDLKKLLAFMFLLVALFLGYVLINFGFSDWATIVISIIGGAAVAYIASYAGAKAGGEIAKEAAILGAKEAGEIQERQIEQIDVKRYRQFKILIESELRGMLIRTQKDRETILLVSKSESDFYYSVPIGSGKFFDKIFENMHLLKSEEFSAVLEALYSSITLESSYALLEKYARRFREIENLHIEKQLKDGKPIDSSLAIEFAIENLKEQALFVLRVIDEAIEKNYAALAIIKKN